jgi:hypothetical protein
MSRSMTRTTFSNSLPKLHSGTRNLILSRTVTNGNRLSIFRPIPYVRMSFSRVTHCCHNPERPFVRLPSDTIRMSVCRSPTWHNMSNPNSFQEFSSVPCHACHTCSTGFVPHKSYKTHVPYINKSGEDAHVRHNEYFIQHTNLKVKHWPPYCLRVTYKNLKR